MAGFDASDWIWPDAVMGRQPQGPSVINWEDPLSNGLLHAIDAKSGTDLVSGRQLLYAGSPRNAVGKYGSAMIGNNATMGYLLMSETLGASATLIGVMNRITRTGNANTPFGLGSTAGTQNLIFQASTTALANRMMLRNVNGVDAAERQYSENATRSGVPAIVSAVWVNGNPANTNIYWNGVLDNGVAVNTAAGSNSTFNYVAINGVRRNTMLYADTGNDCALVLVYKRALSASENAEIAANPWRVLRSPFPAGLYMPYWAPSTSAITLTGANSIQTNNSTNGAVTQAHALSGTSVTQSNTATTAAITQVHALAGENATQENIGSTGTVGGSINLTGAAASHSNTASTAAITQTHDLTAANSSQANTASSGAISQTHVLAGGNATQVNLGSTAALGEVMLTLTGAAGSQSNSGTDGAITQAHVLMAAASVQDNVASSSAIVQAHVLAASNAVQGNLGSIGAIVIGGVTYWPAPEQVLAGVTYGPTGTEYTGTLTGGAGPTAAEIAAAVIAAAQATPIWADTRRMNGAQVLGDGTEPNKWRGGV